ncbi:MAG: hypothetical protein JXR58_02025 [Bacteroidales bacterium]|nr:hypothetical protein [Bacteroidales bacterium]
MKKRIFVLFLFLTTGLFVNSQIIVGSDWSRLHNIKAGNAEISTGFSTWYGSNSINNEFVNGLFSNKYISDDLKLSNKLKEKNRLGYFDDIDLNFAFRPDSMFGTSGYGFMFSLESHSVNHVSFSPDFFNLAFFGNSNYGGKQADLSNMNLVTMRYQQFRAGIFKQESNATYFMGFSLLKGQSYSGFSTKTAYLFTEESGEYLDLALKGTYFASDSVYRNILESTGLGASFDLFFNFFNDNKDLQVKIGITNIGFINWNRHGFYIKTDTLIHFEGIEIPDILNIVEPDISGFSGDTLTKIMHAEAESARFSTALPERIHLAVIKDFSTIKIETGLVYLHDAGFKLPLFYVNGDYSIKQKYNLNLGFHYGGYGTWSTQLGIKANFKDKFILRFSANPEAYIIPSKTRVKALYVGFVYCIN